MRYLGIDPGLQLTGYGCVQAGGAAQGDCSLVEAGVFRLGMGQGEGRRRGEGGRIGLAPVVDRLLELDGDITDLIARLKPDVVGVEALFAHYKHPATAIVMGHARGVILLAVCKAGLDLVELKPNEVKKFLTGHGHASKEQMQGAVQMRLGLAAAPKPPDVADAIAIALCAAARNTATCTDGRNEKQERSSLQQRLRAAAAEQ